MGNSQLLVGWLDVNLNVTECIYLDQSSSLIGYSDLPSLYSIFCRRHASEMVKSGALCTDTQKETDVEWSACSLDEITNWLRVERDIFATEKDNDSSPSCFNLCEAAWHCSVLKALWREANTARDEWRLEGGVGT